MTAPRRDAIVRVERDLHVTIPGPVTGVEARRIVMDWLMSQRDLPEGVTVEYDPPRIPTTRWIDTPNAVPGGTA